MVRKRLNNFVLIFADIPPYEAFLDIICQSLLYFAILTYIN